MRTYYVYEIFGGHSTMIQFKAAMAYCPWSETDGGIAQGPRDVDLLQWSYDDKDK